MAGYRKYIYTNLALLYRRYIHFFQSLKKVYSVNFLSLLYGMSLREENPINLLKFCSCSRRFNGADVRTVHSRYMLGSLCTFLDRNYYLITSVTPFIFNILGLVSVFYSYYCCFPQCMYCNLPRGYNW